LLAELFQIVITASPKFAVDPSATEPLVIPEPCNGTVMVRAPVRSPHPTVTETATGPGDEQVVSDSK
jgi:hypothetical protein